MDRLVWDQMHMQIDPHYADSWRRADARARQGGQDYWWDQGQPAPASAPQMADGATVH